MVADTSFLCFLTAYLNPTTPPTIFFCRFHFHQYHRLHVTSLSLMEVIRPEPVCPEHRKSERTRGGVCQIP
ncbi:hypothetical protein Hanom_Chr04g00332191 [Helianthus anomalus]